MKTTTILPYVRIIVYSDKFKTGRKDHMFCDPTTANTFLAREKPKTFNLYRIERINGTWRTDWELETSAGSMTEELKDVCDRCGKPCTLERRWRNGMEEYRTLPHDCSSALPPVQSLADMEGYSS